MANFNSLILIGLALVLVVEAYPEPGLLSDLLGGDKCEEVLAGDCAYLYDDDDCDEGDWGDKYVLKPGDRKSFSIATLNPIEAASNLRYKNDMESFSLRRGCTLKIYKDSDFSDSERVFTAPANADMHMKEFEGSDETYEDDVESYICTCPANTAQFGNAGSPERIVGQSGQVGAYGPIPANCPALPVSVCAIVYDDEDCTVDDWENSMTIAPGENKAFTLLNGFKYKNTIESIAVRKGCTLKVYDDSDYSDDEFIFRAIQDNLYVTLDSPLSSVFGVVDRAKIDSLDDDISSLKCTCD